MGGWASKGVRERLYTSSEFTHACDQAYKETLTLSQNAFTKIQKYQLTTATTILHRSLSSFPLISRFLPHPPSSSSLIHRSYQQTHRAHSDTEDGLDRVEFREFSVRLFAEAVVESVGKEAVVKSVGVLGIFGVGAVAGAGKDLVRAVAGVYAVGVAASAYFSLAG